MADRGLTAIAGELLPDDDEAPDQMALFGPPQTAKGLAKAVDRGWDGKGRKPGSRNKRTERAVAWLLARHRDPREVLLEIAEANVFDLAALLGCTPFEAAQEKRLAAIGVLPYLAARITPEVIDNRQVIHLTIGSLGEVAGGGSAGTVQVLDPAEFERVENPGADGSSAEPSPLGGGNAGASGMLPELSHNPSHKEGA